jgi:large subunit ribosomal protein L1
MSGKKITEIRKKITKADYNLDEAVSFLKENSTTKFDQTLDVVIKLGVNPAHSDQMVRGVVQLPKGTGKKVKVAAIVKEENIERAKSAGADVVGAESLIDEIKSGKINFDVCITTPDMMPKISAVAKILGPKGLMPNPKLGTVAVDFEGAISKAKSGQVEYRTEKAGIVHAGIGKLSFTADDLVVNFKEFYQAIVKAKPSSAKGVYIRDVFLSSTMGPSLKINLSSI